MALQRYQIGIPGDCCRCMRRKSIRHCPSCGSYQVKPRPSARLIHSDNSITERFMCTRCRHVFDDQELQNHCEAPKYETDLDRAAHELARTHQAILDSDPLTKREECLAPAIREAVASAMTVPEDIRLEWVKLKLSTPEGSFIPSLEEFARKRLEPLNESKD